MLETMAEGLRTGAERIDEGAIDLDLLDREAGEVGKAGIAGAEIVLGRPTFAVNASLMWRYVQANATLRSEMSPKLSAPSATGLPPSRR